MQICSKIKEVAKMNKTCYLKENFKSLMFDSLCTLFTSGRGQMSFIVDLKLNDFDLLKINYSSFLCVISLFSQEERFPSGYFFFIKLFYFISFYKT